MARCGSLLALLATLTVVSNACLAEDFGDAPQPKVVRPAVSPFGVPQRTPAQSQTPAVSLFEPVEMPSSAPKTPNSVLSTPVSGSTAAPPMKYFAPNRGERESLDALRQKYANIMLRRAELMTAEELANSIEQTEQVLDERLAREALGNVEDALRRIAEDFPGTSAGSDARRALSALQHSAVPATPTNTAEVPVRRIQR